MIRRIEALAWAMLLGIGLSMPLGAQESVLEGATRSTPQPTADLTTEPAATSLSLLHDVVEPAAVPWWPLASGWYVIAGLILALLVVWVFVRRQRRMANRYRQAALSELQLIRDDPVAARGISSLLKRVALVAWPRGRVANQSGGSWWQFIDSDGGDSFAEQHGITLDKLSYGSGEEMPTDEEVRFAAVAVENWISHHHGEREG